MSIVGHEKHGIDSLVQPQPPAEEEHAEDAHEQDKRAARHLVDGHRSVQ